jgi:hypothetical protein
VQGSSDTSGVGVIMHHNISLCPHFISFAENLFNYYFFGKLVIIYFIHDNIFLKG